MTQRRRDAPRGELATVVALAATFCLALAGFLGGLRWTTSTASTPATSAATTPASWPKLPSWDELVARLGRDDSGGEQEPAAGDEVAGHFEEANVGAFDLVDGVAYRGRDGGVVVFATSEPIASAALSGSPCPMTQARALALLRDARWNEVTLDGDGDSPYFAYGSQYEGQGRAEDPGDHWVSGSLELEAGRASGQARHEDYGGFRFDLPLHAPASPEPTQAERFDSRIWNGNRVPGTYEAFLAYDGVRRAALASDLDGLLAAQGFTAAQIAAVRALPGIEADLVEHAGRFVTTDELSPDHPTQVDQGWAQLAAAGRTPAGALTLNTYELAPCGGALVLVGIYLNPQ